MLDVVHGILSAVPTAVCQHIEHCSVFVPLVDHVWRESDLADLALQYAADTADSSPLREPRRLPVIFEGGEGWTGGDYCNVPRIEHEGSSLHEGDMTAVVTSMAQALRAQGCTS